MVPEIGLMPPVPSSYLWVRNREQGCRVSGSMIACPLSRNDVCFGWFLGWGSWLKYRAAEGLLCISEKSSYHRPQKKNNMKRGCGSTLGVADSVYRRRGVRCSFGPANLNLSQVLGQLGVWLPQPHTKGHARTHLSHARKDCLTARITRRWVHPNNSAR